MKGIILAAGKGTRMYPMTLPVCKPLLPVYDKPLIYYPLAVLMQAGIRDILIIVPPDEMYSFIKLLGDGADFGVNLTYRIQQEQRGIADAFCIGKTFIGDDDVCLVLGDNILCGAGLNQALHTAAAQNSGATIFGYHVDDPRPFGVVEIGPDGRALSIEEKPARPKSNYAVPGVYFYDNSVVDVAGQIRPSARGELEITPVNEHYLACGRLRVVRLEQPFTWLDAGNAQSLLSAANTIMRLQQSEGRLIACLEEIAWRMGYIGDAALAACAKKLEKTAYGAYLQRLCEQGK